MRWHWSKWRPRASVTIALITSPCEQTRYVASLPSRSFQSLIALTARCCMSSIDSPSGPGNLTALGGFWTPGRSGSLASSASGLPVQSPYLHSPTRSSTTGSAGPAGPACPFPAATSSATVCLHRSSGLVTIAARAPSVRACARPRSSRPTPGVQPVSTCPVVAVRPCRTSRTVVTYPDFRTSTASSRHQEPLTRDHGPRLTERVLGVAEADQVARGHLDLAADAPAVDPGAVGRLQVGEQPAVLRPLQRGVPPGDRHIGDRQVAVGVPADAELVAAAARELKRPRPGDIGRRLVAAGDPAADRRDPRPRADPLVR